MTDRKNGDGAMTTPANPGADPDGDGSPDLSLPELGVHDVGASTAARIRRRALATLRTAPRQLANDEVIDLGGGKRVRYRDTPHTPHGWDAGLIFEESNWRDPSSRSTAPFWPASCPIQRSNGTGNGHKRSVTPIALLSRRINSGVERSSPSLTK